MELDEIIEGLENQAQEKDRLSGGDPDSVFTKDAEVLMNAANLIRNMKSVWVIEWDDFEGKRQKQEFDDPEDAMLEEYYLKSKFDFVRLSKK